MACMERPANESERDAPAGPDRGSRASRPAGRSQVIELFLHVASALGFESDRDVAELSGATPENAANWRTGAVREFKTGTLAAVKEGIARAVRALREEALQVTEAIGMGLQPVEIEQGSGPADLHRQFSDRVAYDYLGHRFLYFEPHGALAWQNLLRAGYGQDCWVDGVDDAATAWLDPTKDRAGRCKGPIAQALRMDRRGPIRGLDVVSLGPGDGTKEVVLLRRLAAVEGADRRLPWVAYMPVDVSIPLLLEASRAAWPLLGGSGDRAPIRHRTCVPVCGDFEEGPLSFAARLPTAVPSAAGGVRLVLMLGNVFGNLRDESWFVRQKLRALTRPGDLVWLEVGVRLEPLEKDPLYPMTRPNQTPTAAEANRRLLLEGPYRRWQAATSRRPSELDLRIWLRQDDDSCPIPGSVNFCHDLVIQDERRVCTMLYSRRYHLESLTAWIEGHGFAVERLHAVADAGQRVRVAHVLLRRTG